MRIEPDGELIRELYARFGLAYYESECLHRELCFVLAWSGLSSARREADLVMTSTEDVDTVEVAKNRKSALSVRQVKARAGSQSPRWRLQ